MSIGTGIAIAGMWLAVVAMGFAPEPANLLSGYTVACALLGTLFVCVFAVMPGILREDSDKPGLGSSARIGEGR